MIYLGQNTEEKKKQIVNYCQANSIEKVFMISPQKFSFQVEIENIEYIEYDEVIKYKFFYRLLKEISKDCLIVINECMRTSNRNDLTYNCIRHYLNQTNHQLIFQYLPFVNDFEDFMILFDFDTKSQWKREKFSKELLSECNLNVKSHQIVLNAIDIVSSDEMKSKYESEKEALFKSIGLKDPHTIPRNLHLVSGKEKLKYLESGQSYIGRNNRFKLDNLETYKEENFKHQHYTLFEFCHNFIDFNDVITLTEQIEYPVLVTDLKVDIWYFERFKNWTKQLENGYASLQQ